jgi:hypothetical protein
MNKDSNPVMARPSHVVQWYGHFTGADGANGTAPGGEVVSATRTAEGIYDLVLRTGFPATDITGATNVLFADVQVVGNAADRGFVAAYNPEAKTMTVELYTTADAADDMAAKVVRIKVDIRNSTSRRGKR